MDIKIVGLNANFIYHYKCLVLLEFTFDDYV